MEQTAVMPQKKVRAIPPTIQSLNVYSTQYITKRVAAYCRVSTKQDEQLNSYENQVNHYTDRINREAGWKLVGIYADKGITGTSMKKRDEFKKLIRQCKRGKVTFDDEDGSFDDVPSYDDERFETDESDEAYDFCGCWEYQDDDLWLCVYNDSSYEWYDEEGLYGGGSYYIEGGVLYLEQEDVTYEAKFGGLVASNGSTLFSSILPDYDGNDMDGAEDFIGCWEDTSEDIWLEIHSDGT